MTHPIYAPNNYRPVKTAPPPLAISPGQFRQARLCQAEYISPDGSRIYARRGPDWIYADWGGTDYGSWWPAGELPDGLVKLDEGQ